MRKLAAVLATAIALTIAPVAADAKPKHRVITTCPRQLYSDQLVCFTR